MMAETPSLDLHLLKQLNLIYMRGNNFLNYIMTTLGFSIIKRWLLQTSSLRSAVLSNFSANGHLELHVQSKEHRVDSERKRLPKLQISLRKWKLLFFGLVWINGRWDIKSLRLCGFVRRYNWIKRIRKFLTFLRIWTFAAVNRMIKNKLFPNLVRNISVSVLVINRPSLFRSEGFWRV